MEDEIKEEVPVPMTEIVLRAPIGSTHFEMRTENCDPMQLFGAAKILELIGMEAFADMRAQSAAIARRIVVPGQRN